MDTAEFTKLGDFFL